MLRTIAVAVVVAPLAAAAQVEVSRATITGTPVVRTDVLHVCAERNDRLWDRSALLDRDKQDIDAEGRAIDRLTAQLDLEKSGLDAPTPRRSPATTRARRRSTRAWPRTIARCRSSTARWRCSTPIRRS